MSAGRCYVVRCDCVGEARYIGSRGMSVRRQRAAKRFTRAKARRLAADGCGRVVRIVPRKVQR